ncbi:unnamed protein product [Brassicogethes aeneus]|uniref:Sas10 C-terminal domain-containing protein n=1 Tax=Brassicogethes aeneus TaxID=1431903 RepID=A0A9P0BES6_BRAAE|nr:unnamed protein product [Brassicogethes aeneus]
MPSHLKFDDEEYNPSDSEDDYTEKEKGLLKKVRNRKRKDSESEDEVLGVGADDSDEDQSDIALSDVEGQEDDDLPNERAWGKDRRKYYSTDYVDADYGGFDGKDAHLAELEEEEAKNLQKQLAEQLDDDDFSLDIFTKKSDEDKKKIEEVVKTDISKLSKRQKLQILEKESPEFFGLIEDFEEKILIAKELLNPVIQKYKKGQIPNCGAIDFVQTHYELILNYATNIYMYLLLKSSRVNVENHPVAKRLYQYRQLLTQLESTFEEIIKPQIEVLLLEEEEQKTMKSNQKKTLQILNKINKRTAPKPNKKKSVNFADEQPSKKQKLEKENEEEETEQNEEMEVEENQENELERRKITYQMEKNKGLTPHRKKELRNPRVKHRQKFRKAVIRRKGAVREPRKELSRYGGEISGIKATVSKSIKIK